MDTGTGNIYSDSDKINVKNIKGKLIPWEVGEVVTIKDCSFKVKQINVFPNNEIILQGTPNSIFKEISVEERFAEFSDEISKNDLIEENQNTQNTMRNFLRDKHKKN